MITGIIVGFIVGALYGFFILPTKPQHYKYRIQGSDKLYKMNKIVTEEWADGLAKWECIELVDDSKKTLNDEGCYE